MNISEKELMELTEASIKKLSFGPVPEGLYKPMEYILEAGGKRVRPLLCLMACNLFSDKVEKAIYAACAVEVFHNFTLMHDDIMDNAEMRRGRPVVHKVWSENTAILSGDAMLVEAYKLVARVPADVLPEVLRLFSTTASEVCEGQQYDMEFEDRENVEKSEYMEMIRLKTAVLLACSLKMGALCGGADKHDADALYDFGINMGLAFQLRDDYLDTFGDSETFGKKIGGDILCGKKTYLLIDALENLGSGQRAELQNLICGGDSVPAQQKIKMVTDLYLSAGADRHCQEAAEMYCDRAIASLKSVKGNVNDLCLLETFLATLVNRRK